MRAVLAFTTVVFSLYRTVLLPGSARQRSPQTAPEQHWVATWGAAQTPARVPAPAAAVPAAAPPTPAPPAPSGPARRYNLPPAVSSFNHQTVRMTLRTSIGGDGLRIRLYNAFGAQAVRIAAAHIARPASPASASTAEAGLAIDPTSDHALTFSESPAATLYAGQVLTSDPVKMTVAPLSDLVVSLYLPQATSAPTTHALGLRPAYTSGPGDFTSAITIPDPASVSESYYWLEGVDVLAPRDASAIVTFGDSITDGDQSTPGKDAMWPAVLAERLERSKRTEHIAVVNEGISGNRVLGDNVSALARFQHEALDVPGVKWITLLEGINDINLAMRANPPNTDFSADDLIAAYRQMIELAHARGVKVIGCTMTPYGGSSGFREAGEVIRQAANRWIRTSGAFDAVIDFDKATQDANNPRQFSPAADSPDLLHPGDAGYRMMAEAIDLRLFAPSPVAGSGKHTQ